MTFAMNPSWGYSLALVLPLTFGLSAARATMDGADAPKPDRVVAVAVLDFETSDKTLAPLGPQIGTLMTTFLSTESHLITVEREELGKILSEQELGLSGTVQPETASKVGRLTGAKVLVTGRVFTIDKELIMVAKIISTETSRVFGETVRLNVAESVAAGVEKLAKAVSDSIASHADALSPPSEPTEALVARLRKSLEGRKLPTVSVAIDERHNGRETVDPAAETEVSFILKEVGFTVLDADAAVTEPDVRIIGKGFSEFGARRGNLISCRGRVEIKAIDRATGTILAVDSQTEVALDLGEQMAGKKCLEQAAARVAERIIRELVDR